MKICNIDSLFVRIIIQRFAYILIHYIQLRAIAVARGRPTEFERPQYTAYARYRGWNYLIGKIDSVGEKIVVALTVFISVLSFLFVWTWGHQMYDFCYCHLGNNQKQGNDNSLQNGNEDNRGIDDNHGNDNNCGNDDKVLKFLFLSIQSVCSLWLVCNGILAIWVFKLDVDAVNGLGLIVDCFVHVTMMLTCVPALVIVGLQNRLKQRSNVCRRAVPEFIVVWNTFAFSAFVFFSFPSIILAFYVNPSGTVVRLSFIALAVIVLVVINTVFIFSGINTLNMIIQNTRIKDCIPIVSELGSGTEQSKPTKILAILELVISILTLVVALGMIYAVGLIVFEKTSDETNLSDLLSILPTLLTIPLASKYRLIVDKVKDFQEYGWKKFVKEWHLNKQASTPPDENATVHMNTNTRSENTTQQISG